MYKSSWNRKIFNSGIHFLKVLLFVIFEVLIIRFIASSYLNINLTHEMSVMLGMLLLIGTIIFEYINSMSDRMLNSLHNDSDRKEAIEILESHKLKVAILFTDLPKDTSNNEIRECVDAFITLKNQNIPFVLVNSEDQVTSRIYYLGEHGKHNHNKYELILKRKL